MPPPERPRRVCLFEERTAIKPFLAETISLFATFCKGPNPNSIGNGTRHSSNTTNDMHRDKKWVENQQAHGRAGTSISGRSTQFYVNTRLISCLLKLITYYFQDSARRIHNNWNPATWTTTRHDRSTDVRSTVKEEIHNTYQSTRKVVHTSMIVQGTMCCTSSYIWAVKPGNTQSRTQALSQGKSTPFQ